MVIHSLSLLFASDHAMSTPQRSYSAVSSSPAEYKLWSDVANGLLDQWQREYSWSQDVTEEYRQQMHDYLVQRLSTSDLVKVSEAEVMDLTCLPGSSSPETKSSPSSASSASTTTTTAGPQSKRHVKTAKSISNPQMSCGYSESLTYWRRKRARSPGPKPPPQPPTPNKSENHSQSTSLNSSPSSSVPSSPSLTGSIEHSSITTPVLCIAT